MILIKKVTHPFSFELTIGSKKISRDPTISNHAIISHGSFVRDVYLLGPEVVNFATEEYKFR